MILQGERYYTEGSIWNMIDVGMSVCLLLAANAYFQNDASTMTSLGALGVAAKWFGALDFMRAFRPTAAFVRMITVIVIDLRWFALIAALFLVASSFFFLINDADKADFEFRSTEHNTIGPAWPLFTMWRGMLGDFDVEAALTKKSSIAMYLIFQILVVVLMMNL